MEEIWEVKITNRTIAKGKCNGITREVFCTLEDGELIIDVDGFDDHEAERRLADLIKDQPPMGGTYYPEPNTLFAAFNVLKNTFFDDDNVEIEIEGDIGTIPHEEGVIY